MNKIGETGALTDYNTSGIKLRIALEQSMRTTDAPVSMLLDAVLLDKESGVETADLSRMVVQSCFVMKVRSKGHGILV